jgi:hypothetical protein
LPIIEPAFGRPDGGDSGDHGVAPIVHKLDALSFIGMTLALTSIG